MPEVGLGFKKFSLSAFHVRVPTEETSLIKSNLLQRTYQVEGILMFKFALLGCTLYITNAILVEILNESFFRYHINYMSLCCDI